jgi:hypothetical protein
MGLETTCMDSNLSIGSRSFIAFDARIELADNDWIYVDHCASTLQSDGTAIES